MILQEELSGERLAQEIEKLVLAPEQLSQMEEAARRLAHGDAAAAAVDIIAQLANFQR
jgi:UDP-N-acetylglucosamine:LPS N-acetylglucosamine transferase